MRTKLLLGLAVYLAASSVALADGFYAGAGLGVVKVKDESALDTNVSSDSFKFSDATLGWRLFAGYDLNEHFALEASYSRSGTAEDVFDISVLEDPVKVETEISTYSASVIGFIPVGSPARLFAKAGYYSGEQKSTVLGMTLDDDDDGLTVGAGIRFDDRAHKVSYRVDFDWFDTEADEVWTLGFGVQYLFGN